ncbi:MAG TPA: VIT domain-containing protein [Pyrinomonadaceae bacterium]|jgi:hypothetical protein|nr:VIT domain-containing protein [Pyrinomonadaceae bacterium]
MLEQTQEPRKQRWGLLTLFAGVILPAISIAVETTTHISAGDFFDPIPTVWHVLLVVFVPLANLQLWLTVRKGRTERVTLLGLTNAAVIGISFFYTIIYAPVLPLAAIALIYFGLGLLPLAPAFSLFAAIYLRLQFWRSAPDGFALRVSGLAFGLFLAFTAMTLIALPVALTRWGLKMAASASPEQSARGIRWLRVVGDKDFLLRACYARTGLAIDPVGFLFSLEDPVTPEEARKIYYRLTGVTFDTSRPPERRGSGFFPQDTFDFDPDQGGTNISGKLKGLSLAQSRMDGSIDADAGLGYIEWTLSFRNDAARQQEARAQVQLPPGGVVSRLTLWVEGEEREAAFAGRARARAAYEQVVRTRLDPVLVTTAGRDRVLVQCFPVPPNGGQMKIRFGITVPLVLEDRAHGRLRLPHFLDRNFRIPDEVNHAVWVESESQLQTESESLRMEAPRTDLYALRGSVKDAELSDAGLYLLASRASAGAQAWTRDPVKNNGEIVRQLIEEKRLRARSRIVLVLDTSGRMAAWNSAISAALKTLPPDVDLRMLLADGNGVYEAGASQHPLIANPEELARLIQSVRFEGGADNVAPLLKAWDIAAENPQTSVIVWIHGPQPLLLQPVEELRQRWERRPDGPSLYAVQADNGPDRIEEGLDEIRSVEVVPRMGPLQSDLERLFAQLTGGTLSLGYVRTVEKTAAPPAQSPSPAAKETSAHLARLWANDEVARLMNARDKDHTEEAIQLATRYQLVTPVSGAVVLETQEQYRQAGLEAVEPGTIPTIPEPEMLLLVAIVGGVLLWLLYRQKLARPGRISF